MPVRFGLPDDCVVVRHEVSIAQSLHRFYFFFVLFIISLPEMSFLPLDFKTNTFCYV